MKNRFVFFAVFLFGFNLLGCGSNLSLGNLIFVVERGTGKLAVIDYPRGQVVKKISLSGNLRHAAMVFDPALHYGYLATRDGSLIRVNLKTLKQDKKIQTSKNSIGIAISQDGKTLAVAEYKPGGITLIDVPTFEKIKFVSANSRVTGLVDGPNNSFLCALMDSNQIWVLSPEEKGGEYQVKHQITTTAPKPFDALITPEGRYYITGHFQTNRVSLVDLWNIGIQAKPVYTGPSQSSHLPVKMVHMEAWAATGDKIFMPVAGQSRMAVLSAAQFAYIDSVPLQGDPLYGMIHPHARELWVTFSGDRQDGKIQIIDTQTYQTLKTLDVGKRIYHMAFTPRGDLAFVASNQTNQLVIIDTLQKKVVKRVALDSPSGIFGVWRAFQIGL